MLLATVVLSQPLQWTYDLDSSTDNRLCVVITLQPLDVDEFEVKTAFRSYHRGHLVGEKAEDLGPSFGPPRLCCVDEFLGNDRSQVFISTSHGRIASWLFDFDGTKLRTVYSRTDGRVTTYPVVGENGKGSIVELWPSQDFLATFHDSGHKDSTGRVRRLVSVTLK